jgi:hypothetical protein
MADLQITARIEQREWFINGKYVGASAPWREADIQALEAEMTGNFHGEWQGTRHFDGKQILANDIARSIENRRLTHKNHPDWPTGEHPEYPIRRSDWGEYRIITNVQ